MSHITTPNSRPGPRGVGGRGGGGGGVGCAGGGRVPALAGASAVLPARPRARGASASHSSPRARSSVGRAAHDAGTQVRLLGAPWVQLGRVLPEILRRVPVGDPLGHVALHVVQAPVVRRAPAYGPRLAAVVVQPREVVVRVGVPQRGRINR